MAVTNSPVCLSVCLSHAGTLSKRRMRNNQAVKQSVYSRCVGVKQDAGSPPLTSERQLVIEVTDENDCRPLFTSDHYTVTVTEDTSPGLSVFQLTAVDADQPSSVNSRLTYDIRPRIDSQSSALVVDPVNTFFDFM